MLRVVPPVVVVQPADHLSTRAADGGVAGVDLPGAGAGHGGDPRIAEAPCQLDPGAVPVVDDDRFPVFELLRAEALERPSELRPAEGRRDHGGERIHDLTIERGGNE